MLIELNLANKFLIEYQLLMTYINDGELPENLHDFIPIRDELYDCIDEVKENMSEYVSTELLSSIEHAIYDEFIYIKKYKDGYVFLNIQRHEYYQVKALLSPLEELIPEYYVVKTALMPFLGELICDGLLQPLPTKVNPLMKKVLRDGYLAAKRSKKLIKTEAQFLTSQGIAPIERSLEIDEVDGSNVISFADAKKKKSK